MWTVGQLVVAWTAVVLTGAAGTSTHNCPLVSFHPNVFSPPIDEQGSCGHSSAKVWTDGVTVPQGSPGRLVHVYCYKTDALNASKDAGSSIVCTQNVWISDGQADTPKVSGACVLPPSPRNGRYEPFSVECGLDNRWKVGETVPSQCVLRYSCHDGYRMAGRGVRAETACQGSQWSPSPADLACDKIPTTDPQPRPPTPTPLSEDTTTTHPLVPVTHPSPKPHGDSSLPGCTLPEDNGENRIYCPFKCNECTTNILYSSCAYKPGSPVTEVAVKVQCERGYRLRNNLDYTTIVCLDGVWVSEMPDCLKLCAPLVSESMYIQCSYGTNEVNCSKPMIPGTTARFRCSPSHKPYPSLAQAGVYQRVLTCRSNGRWTYTLPECEPVCGVSKGTSTVTPVIVDGKDTPLGVYPWHAGLYRQENLNGKMVWNNFCGGTLISNRVVLTAAHCVVLYSPADMMVALGKYYRDWEKDDPEGTVKRGVKAIRRPREYNGAVTTYTWDIALVLLSATVPVNSLTMPVCRDIQQGFDISRGVVGHVVGWGKTAAGGPLSETLLSNAIDLKGYEDCIKMLPRQLAFDKFCGVRGPVSVVEKGDSGGGVTAVFGGLHYIFGIVSFKYDNISVFTNVSWNSHKSWMDIELSGFDISSY